MIWPFEWTQFTVRNIVNPGTSEPTDTFTFSLTNLRGFLINNYLETETITMSEASIFSDANVLFSHDIPGVEIEVTFTLTPSFPIPATGIIEIRYPSQFALIETLSI